MNVVGHDYEGMQNVVFEVSGVIVDGFDYHVGDGRLSQVKRPRRGFSKRSMAANACPELTVAAGKARWQGRLSWRRQVRKTGRSVS